MNLLVHFVIYGISWCLEVPNCTRLRLVQFWELSKHYSRPKITKCTRVHTISCTYCLSLFHIRQFCHYRLLLLFEFVTANFQCRFSFLHMGLKSGCVIEVLLLDLKEAFSFRRNGSGRIFVYYYAFKRFLTPFPLSMHNNTTIINSQCSIAIGRGSSFR